MWKIFSADKVDWWLNLSQAIKDNQFSVMKNMYYNKDKFPATRYWIRTFGDSIGANPITSYMFYQRDDDLTTHALCTSGTGVYKYNWTTRGSAIYTHVSQYETIPWKTTQRTRWDMAVYKNNGYLCNGVDPYLLYTSSTGAVSEIGMVWAVTCTFDHTAEKVLDARMEEDLIGDFGVAFKDLFVYGAKVKDIMRHQAAELFATF